MKCTVTQSSQHAVEITSVVHPTECLISGSAAGGISLQPPTPPAGSLPLCTACSFAGRCSTAASPTWVLAICLETLPSQEIDAGLRSTDAFLVLFLYYSIQKLARALLVRTKSTGWGKADLIVRTLMGDRRQVKTLSLSFPQRDSRRRRRRCRTALRPPAGTWTTSSCARWTTS